MDLVLYYRGPLHANGDATEKHRIREYFHRQLKTLWAIPPFARDYAFAADPNPSDPGAGASFPEKAEILRMGQFPSLIKTVGGNHFLPLVSQRLCAVAEVDLTLLRPEPAGHIVARGGDIDNRIKTLLDSLKIPDANQARPEILGSLEQPFHCLLEDDNLITRLSVRTEHLLEPVASQSEVILILHVKTRRTLETIHNYLIA